MEKAYDISALLVGFKAQGLDLLEDSAKGAVVAVLDWFEASAKLSATPYDDIALILLPQIKRAALDVVDLIDGKDEPSPV